ncbi:hypothetical protein K438DRAFT_1966466 [Mycena galopus ATCC 62051]|nr:hypothetical protein K438DRAFT_1966466 [Mycena galopus ATCC 62051]
MDPPEASLATWTPALGSVLGDSLERYIKTLDRVDADWLGEITRTSWEPVVAELEALNQANKDSSITRRLLSRIRCFVDSLRPFVGSIDIAMGSSGEIVGIIWGALKLIIAITHKFTEHFSVISDTLEAISVELPIFQDYVERLYPESTTVQKVRIYL